MERINIGKMTINNTNIFISASIKSNPNNKFIIEVNIHTYLYMRYRLIDRHIFTHIELNYTYICIHVAINYLPIYTTGKVCQL